MPIAWSNNSSAWTWRREFTRYYGPPRRELPLLQRSSRARAARLKTVPRRARVGHVRTEDENLATIPPVPDPNLRGVGARRSHRNASESRRHRPRALPNAYRSFRSALGRPTGTLEIRGHNPGPNPIPVLVYSPVRVKWLHSHLQKLSSSTGRPRSSVGQRAGTRTLPHPC